VEAITQATKTIIAFIKAPTWADGQHVVEQRQDQILTDSADIVFAMLQQTAHDHAAAHYKIATSKTICA
jgi:hypothetical protein